MQSALRILTSLVLCFPVMAADPVFSGPQPGEPTTSFKVLDVASTPASSSERDPISENAGSPTAIVFVHAIERSLVPLLRTIDEYGFLRKDKLKTEVVFLAQDRIAGEQRARSAMGSLRLQSRVGLSLDGIEGPGNYGLNKECMMTIVGAKENKAVANFALVQPGIADAPKIIEALAKLCGDTMPPTVEQLTEKQMARSGATPGGRMQRERAMEREKNAANPDAPKRPGAVRGIDAVTNEFAVPGKRDPFPGAVPTDGKLNSLLRQFIRPTNDDATVDKVMADVKEHIKGNADLEKQAIDGWTRVLHFGERYGTAYSRKVGAQLLETLRAEQKKP
jgi:hypothetical protein